MSDPRTIVSLAGIASLGACVGSFLNVVAYRLPRECMSVVKPRSRCPKCTRWIAWYDNLPVLSWLLLRGRCRGCGLGISVRYPLVELATALLFLATAILTMPPQALAEPLTAGGAWGAFGLRALAVSVLFVLAIIDFDWEILPDQLTLGGLVAAPVMVFLAPSIQPSDGGVGQWVVAGRTLLDLCRPGGVAVVHGFLAGGGAALFLWLVGWLGSKAFKKEAMGLGDVKMLAAMGALLGFWSFLALALAVVSGAVIGLGLKICGKGSYIRFGPFLAFGAWAVLVDGATLLDMWIGMVR